MTAIAKIRIAIVDDELHGLKTTHYAPSEFDFIDDRTAPELEELWSLVNSFKINLTPLSDANNDLIQATIYSQAFIDNLLLTDQFQTQASTALKALLSHFLSLNQTIKKQKGTITTVFSNDTHDITYLGARPEASQLLTYDLILLDLIMETGISTTDDLCIYLKGIATAAGENKIPPIILFSSNSALQDSRLEYAKTSQISSAGLYILDKAKLINDKYSTMNLDLIYAQLTKQSETAHRMRNYINSYERALSSAKDSIQKTLWNLDAGAIQKIHHSAYLDNDPFDEHLNELISREYSWHVESNAAVIIAINALDESLQKHMVGKKINYHFVVPQAQEHSKKLISHFGWFGSSAPAPFKDLAEQDALKQFNKLIPYGSLLIDDEFNQSKIAYIHITQQCDLNNISRDLNSTSHIMFVSVKANEIHDHSIQTYNNSQQVAKNCMIADIPECDFEYIKGQTLSISVKDFLARAKTKNLKVVARLRHDITNLFKFATINDLMRPAAQKLEREEVVNAKVFLKHNKKFEEIGQDSPPYRFVKNEVYGPTDQDACDIALKVIKFADQLSPKFDGLSLNELTQALIKSGKHGVSLLEKIKLEIVTQDSLDNASAEASRKGGDGSKINLIYIIQTTA